MDKRATLADVARIAGLSPAAASLILNNKPGARLSEDSKRRVLAAAEALGYRPNVAARGLVTSKTNSIALITDHVATTRFGSGIVKGALGAADELDHVVFLLETDGDRKRTQEAVAAVLDRQVDGIIFSTVRAREMEVPPTPPDVEVVMLNSSNKNHRVSILPDEYEGGKAAVELLASSGITKGIVLLGQNEAVEKDENRSITIGERLRGIRAGLSDLGESFLASIETNLWEPEDGFEATRTFISQMGRDQVEAIICLNDRLAFGAYQALAELGAKIPGDISIISFDNDEVAAYLRPGLTTVGIPYEEMGAEAVRRVIEPQGEGVVKIPMKLLKRGSVRS